MRARIGRSPLARRRELAGLPASPPPHVLRDVARAAHRVDELLDLERELHFGTGADHRVLVQVRDLHGHILRTLTPSEALGVLSGGPLRTPPSRPPASEQEPHDD